MTLLDERELLRSAPPARQEQDGPPPVQRAAVRPVLLTPVVAVVFYLLLTPGAEALPTLTRVVISAVLACVWFAAPAAVLERCLSRTPAPSA